MKQRRERAIRESLQSVITDDASPPAFYGCSNGQKVAMTAVENESQPLVRYAKEKSRSCNTAS